ncbi:MAG: hypothetical protein JWO26_1845 [Rhodospirillales bacterium]|jgi:hypothetical protein|nr:hypothetical protein [Rhodospirillales bacterium]MDB5382213.1 hypothetical protein [Rhodospirillales bacterium]
MHCALSLLAALLVAAPAIAQTTTSCDSSGRGVSTRSTDSTGLVTIRDAQGRVIGTERTDTTGTTTLRDGRGRATGTTR